jgi:ATP phosphoribosyltransferase
LIAVVVFIVIPKNSGLVNQNEKAFSFLTNIDVSRILEVRGEDVPFWVRTFREKGKDVIGFVGEDLYDEFCTEEQAPVQILKRITWDDPSALFGKPSLCLIGPINKDLETMPKSLVISIASKYKKLAKQYLDFLEKKGFSFKKIYLNGSVEVCCVEGIADMAIDIVCTGSSIKKYNLKIYDVIMKSDFLIIGGKQ